MTQRSTEELQRQRDDAYSRHNQTRIDLAMAEKRLHDAKCRDSGLMGKKVTNKKGVQILVHDVEFIGRNPCSIKGFAYKADGTLGYSERRFYLGECTIEGGAA